MIKHVKFQQTKSGLTIYGIRAATYLVRTNFLPGSQRKKAILTSFKRPKWSIRQNKRLHLTMFSRLLEKTKNKYN